VSPVHPDAALAAAALGGAAGPLLAGLTVRVPVAGPWLTAGWWRGAGTAAGRRVLLAALGAAGAGLAGLGIGFAAALPAYLWFGLAAAALSVIDAEHRRLPNRLVYPTCAAGLVLLGMAALAGTGPAGAYLRAVAAMAVLAGLFLLLALLCPGALGLGDVKLAGVLGLYLGYLGAARLYLGVAAGVALGAVAALALLAARRAGWRSQFAYGPALLAGAVLAVGLGQILGV
jgi:leader peptidase (prepilin peptidase) / N-methyltransferase